ncbi:MAG: CocE/NonD family hydrolase [Mycobacterium sp.]|nr:CocE/NonD family hydrolase [Mycobacterium sp.]
MRSTGAAAGIIVEKNVAVPMSDGVTLRVNVFRPDHRAPVVVSMTPYGKDKTPDRIGMLAMRLSGVRFGQLNCSPMTGFESPDPKFWVSQGYAVVQGDARGMHASDGIAGFLTDQDARDYAEIIGWAADKPWSTGSVGLNGVSYLCMSQWRVAALRPRGLAAIVAWEGASDLLREFAYHGGIPETGFLPIWWKVRMRRGTHRGTSMGEDFLADSRRHPLDDAYWAAKRPDLSAIDVPALVGASWSDHGLHTRGTLLAYEQLRGPKWLVVHGRRKWETYYSAEALELQRRFLDHFLKGPSVDWADEPAVRYELRHTRTRYTARTSTQWPLPHATLQTLYLDAASMTLTPQPSTLAHTASYSAVPRRRQPDRTRFTHRFTEDTEITGGMALTVWISTDEGTDLDVFVAVRKHNSAGAVVPFYGYNGYINDGVAKGWLRGSHRELDATRSRPERPFHAHRTVEPIEPGEPTQMTIEIWPSSTHFEAGSELVVEIVGHDADRYPVLRHKATVNRGIHTIHTGGATPSALVVAVIPAPIIASQSVTDE